jgi:serine/threonine-protein kinase
MIKKYFKQGQKFGKWTLDSYLGGGGNGVVWKCKDEEGNEGAIKLLKSVKSKLYARFLDETTVIERNSDIPGIIPMLDRFLPDKLDTEVPFYVMPVAESAERTLKQKTIEEKIYAVLEVSVTIKELHRRGISHRDIKPANLLVYNSRFSLADFGLVDYPDKKDISSKNEEIGPKWTMAPEMRRESSSSDGLKADMYSLAKTLWIILTENIKGFDGQYSASSILGLRRFYNDVYTTPIDTLLTACTDNNPKARPDIDEFISSLETWKKLNEGFHERNQEQWFEIQQKLFPTAFPKRVIWEDLNDIVTVLKALCTYDNLNHMFFPDGGGLDLEDVRLATEQDCIELDFQLIDIVKPKRLIFESFGYDPEWNYFRLELDELEPSGVYEDLDDSEETDEIDEETGKPERNREYLSELYPGVYDKYDLVEHRHEYRDNGYEIPDTARHVTRYLKGCFVIFNKRSIYNLTSSTYDGRHNEMDTDEFREYIQRNINSDKEAFEKKIMA